MTEDQEILGEAIIRYIKNHGGEANLFTMYKKSLSYSGNIADKDFSKQFQLVKQMLLDAGYIKYRYPTGKNFFMLGDKAENFTSFEEIRKMRAEKESRSHEKENLELEALRKQVKDYATEMKQKRRELQIAVAAIIIEALALLLVLWPKLGLRY